MVKAHFERAKTYGTLAERFKDTFGDVPDWEIVIRFYSAVQLLDGYFESKGQKFDTGVGGHEKRKRAIQESPELTKNPKFFVAYRRLKDVSEQVRYDAEFRATANDLASARSNLTLINSMVAPKVESFLAKP